jgi:dimethylargininase
MYSATRRKISIRPLQQLREQTRSYFYGATTRVNGQKNFGVETENTNATIAKAHYTTALMRGVAKSLPQALAMSSPEEPISYSKAVSQHNIYAKAMSLVVSKQIEIAADENHPDCVFIEDTAVVIDGKAVITRIGAESRRGEVDAIKEELLRLGLDVYDMRDVDTATCDGGDVLYPVTYSYDPIHLNPQIKKGGNHLFVGISSRTNYAGVEYLQKIFQDVDVIPVTLDDGGENENENGNGQGETLHLKSAVTHLDENTLLVPEGNLGDHLEKAMKLEELGYTVIRLPDIAGCNVVSANGYIIAQPNLCQKTRDILEKEVSHREMKMKYIDASEFSKCDGALTCKSVLIAF